MGGGAYPSIADRRSLEYDIVDPDDSQTCHAPNDVNIFNTELQDLPVRSTYDLILSKMVLEHVEEPDSFHAKAYELLGPGGKALHFYACKYSLPSLINHSMPTAVSDGLLKWTKRRPLNAKPKYQAFYREVYTSTLKAQQYFAQFGYTEVNVTAFVGHDYLKNWPALKYIEGGISALLYALRLRAMSSVAILELKK